MADGTIRGGDIVFHLANGTADTYILTRSQGDLPPEQLGATVGYDAAVAKAHAELGSGASVWFVKSDNSYYEVPKP